MSVTVRPYRRGGWEVDIRVVFPDKSGHRQRRRAPVTSKTAAQRWGEERERIWYQELMHPKPTAQLAKEVPTVEQFAERFIDGYARANRQKPSGIAGKESILKRHLTPFFRTTKLDAITNEDIQRLKVRLRERSPKTVNNVVSVLNTMFKVAVDWGVIERMP